MLNFLKLLFTFNFAFIFDNPILAWFKHSKATISFTNPVQWSHCSICGKDHNTRSFFNRKGIDHHLCFKCYLTHWDNVNWDSSLSEIANKYQSKRNKKEWTIINKRKNHEQQ